MARNLQIKRGNEADMPVLAAGEPGFALDTKKMFVGTGTENVPINMDCVKKDANGNVAVTGNLILKGSGNFGNKINFGDGDYVHIWEATDDTLELKGTRIKMYSGSTEVLKIENGKAYINGTEMNANGITLEFDVLCSSKGYSCATINSNGSYTETLSKTATGKKTAMRTTTKISNGYREVIAFYREDGVAVMETRTKTITMDGNKWSEVTV